MLTLEEIFEFWKGRGWPNIDFSYESPDRYSIGIATDKDNIYSGSGSSWYVAHWVLRSKVRDEYSTV